MQKNPREFVRDPVMLEFLGLPGTGRLLESDLEQALLDDLQGFLFEVGKGLHLLLESTGPARSRRTFTSTWCFASSLL